jgi:glycosyltransferase involved in cell wall biosynthesis
MHNLTKIKLFRTLLWVVFPFALIFVYPFALLRRRKRTSLFFLFDRYAIGGAQRVYFDILESVSDIQKTVYFTRESGDASLKESFYSLPNTECYDIHFWCDNLLFRLFSVHFISFYVNRHDHAKVLGSNSTFFYDMLPFLNKQVTKIELLHNFSFGKKGMEFFGLANHKFLDERMVIDNTTKENIIEQYKFYGVPQSYNNRIQVVEYGVNIPEPVVKSPVPPLKILYAGRGTRQKRIWLLNRIAAHFISNGSPVEFTFVGSMGSDLSAFVKKHCNVLGETGDQNVMRRLFSEHHVVILTSAFEGFPVVVKEGMSFGCVPIVTALPGNRIHLKHLSNALLIESVEDENRVVEEGIRNIEMLISQPELLAKLSQNAYEYAQKKFGKQDFLTAYRTLLVD